MTLVREIPRMSKVQMYTVLKAVKPRAVMTIKPMIVRPPRSLLNNYHTRAVRGGFGGYAEVGVAPLMQMFKVRHDGYSNVGKFVNKMDYIYTAIKERKLLNPAWAKHLSSQVELL